MQNIDAFVGNSTQMAGKTISLLMDKLKTIPETARFSYDSGESGGYKKFREKMGQRSLEVIMAKPIHFVVSAVIATILFILPAFAEKRVALVIGNSSYTHVSKLANPKNDAQAISAALRRLGFEVIEGIDLNKQAMDQRIRKFASSLEGAKVALFYYAGHGMQVNGQNYLAPVTARLRNEADLDFDMVPLNLVLRQMGRTERTNLVFLDACRDNPLLKDLGRSMGATRSANLTRGLARVKTVVGTMISYATAPDQVALDGRGKNSPFTTALLKHIDTPGLDVANMMIKVRKDVIKLSNGKQVPWDHSSLTGQFFFKPGIQTSTLKSPAGQRPSAGQPLVAPGVHESTFELTYWNSVKDSKDANVIKTYLDQYPRGRFAALARAKIGAIRRTEQRQKQARLTPPTKSPATRVIPPRQKQPSLKPSRKRSACKVATWTKNACAALYVGKGNAMGGAWGNTKAIAQRKARKGCSKHSKTCKLRRWVCNGKGGGNKYAAIAFSNATGAHGWSYDYSSRALAERIAMRNCRKHD